MTTKETTTAKKVNHPWSADALLAKAQRYAEDMLSHSPEDWQFGLVSTFVLEFPARAALANISPTLLRTRTTRIISTSLSVAPPQPLSSFRVQST